VRLTPVGEVLLGHAQSVLAALRGAAADVAAITSGDRGRLRVGTIQSVGTRVLPSLITRFAVERPGVEIVLHEAHNPMELLAMVEEQELDVTFFSGSEPGVEGPFEARLVLEDPFALLAPATPEWLDRPSVSIEEIATHPLIGNRNPCCYGQTLLTFGDLSPNFVFHSDDNSTVQGCVAAGVGLSLTPLLTIDFDDPTTTVVPLEPEVPSRLISVVWLAGRRPSALLDAFVEATAAVCDEVARGWAVEQAA
jgi:DNA-binding transcriptional LysR family regulator